MDVILHLGAHRTASASFQHYLQTNLTRLEPAGLGVWMPVQDRGAHASGSQAAADAASPEDRVAKARDRVLSNLDLAEARGVKQLIVSDENVIGTPGNLLQDGRLYSDIGERIARYADVFGGRLTRIVLSIRSQDSYWSSIAAHAVAQGQPVPTAAQLDQIATQTRSWRDAITDLACGVADSDIQIQPYEVFGSLPEWRLAAMTGMQDLPSRNAREWLNRAPGRSELRNNLSKRGADPDLVPAGDGRWQPFDRDQTTALREAYADDLFWLRGGADGLASLIEETGPAKAGKNPAAGDTKRGQTDGKDDRRLA